jgi:hypothetical protein
MQQRTAEQIRNGTTKPPVACAAGTVAFPHRVFKAQIRYRTFAFCMLDPPTLHRYTEPHVLISKNCDPLSKFIIISSSIIITLLDSLALARIIFSQ